jgi:hypothetical protein
MPHEKLGALRCPKCGNDLAKGGRFRYVETVESSLPILAVKDGALEVEVEPLTADKYDGGAKPHFECQGPVRGPWCGHRWPVLDWIQALIDWV